MDYDAQDKTVDTSLAFRRLKRNTLSIIIASPSIALLEPDKLVSGLAAGVGLDSRQLVILRVIVGVTPVTLVVVPATCWNSPADRLKLFELKSAAAFMGHRAVLVPEGIVQRQPRLNNCQLIEKSDVHVTADQRVSVMAYLIENGPTALIDLAKAMRHDMPVAAILHLAADGVVAIDNGRTIGPYTTVELVDAELPQLAV